MPALQSGSSCKRRSPRSGRLRPRRASLHVRSSSSPVLYLGGVVPLVVVAGGVVPVVVVAVPVVVPLVWAPPPTEPFAASCCCTAWVSSGEVVVAGQPPLFPPPAPTDRMLIDTPQTLAATVIGIC